MAEGNDGTVVGAEGEAAGELEQLRNALRFEQAKNQVLLEECVAMEEELVNRCLADFESVVGEESREFWREQLLTNRDKATGALRELQRGQAAPAVRRPLHNRAESRPVARDAGGAEQRGAADDRAARIRNRAQEIARAERVPFSVAFRRAEGETASQ